MIRPSKRGWPGILVDLCKIKITAAVTLTTAAGYFLGKEHISGGSIIPPVLGVFALACGSSALNEIQEWHTDAQMVRTCRRPLPAHKISIASAAWIAGILLLAGSLILAATGWVPFILGLFSVFWYNGVYTYLKRITAFAVLPGALIGAIPPAIGWAAASHGYPSFAILSLCLFLFIWQIPHFWLLALRYSEDYKRAGFPTLDRSLSRKAAERLSSLWIILAAITGALFPVWSLGIWSNTTAYPFYAAGSILILIGFGKLSARGNRQPNYGIPFVGINAFALIILLSTCYTFWIS